jgi:hypothetical protein
MLMLIVILIILVMIFSLKKRSFTISTLFQW